jgi:hypothetical protein
MLLLIIKSSIICEGYIASHAYISEVGNENLLAIILSTIDTYFN